MTGADEAAHGRRTGLLADRVVLITGAARGQGRAHATTCAREGADVVLVDLAAQLPSVDYPMATPDDLAETARQVEALGGRALAIAADVRSQQQLDASVDRALAAFGRIDVLVANAGIWSRAPFWELSEQAWEEMLGVNLTGVWKSAKAVAPHMIERGRGSIVLTSSVNGLEPGRDYAHYVAAKHGVVGLMRNIALELAPHGVRCNAVHPGAVRTPMNDHPAAWDMYAGHERGTPADMLEAGYRYSALRGTTFLSPQAIADATLWLNSDLASAVTGVSLPVDAGHSLLPHVNQDPVRDPDLTW